VRQLTREPFGSHRMRRTIRRTELMRVRRRTRLEPSVEAIHERAVRQVAVPVSIRTIYQSTTSEPSSEPSSNMPGPSQSEQSAEAPRASHQAIRRARLDPNHPPKQYTSERWGKLPGPPRTIHRSDTRAFHRASRCRGAVCDPALKPQPAEATDIEPNPLDYSL